MVISVTQPNLAPEPGAMSQQCSGGTESFSRRADNALGSFDSPISEDERGLGHLQIQIAFMISVSPLLLILLVLVWSMSFGVRTSKGARLRELRASTQKGLAK